jgi:glucosamine kinase
MLQYIIGIDGGGSKTHALLMDTSYNIIDESYSGAANIRTDVQLAYNSISNIIQELINKNKLNPDNIQIGIGVAGYSVEEKRQKLLRLLHLDYPQVKITSDSHIACLAAHGGNNGAIIICGTGISAYYIKQEQSQQIGGWGFPHGDLGGTAWIGLEICKATCKAIDKVIKWSPLLIEIFKKFDSNVSIFKTWLINATPRNFAEIAKIMLHLNQPDQIAQQIFNNAIQEVSGFIRAVINNVPELPIKITGGLAKKYHPILKQTFTDLEIMDKSPAYGACLLVKT